MKSKDQKREEAAVRQAEYSALTTTEKIARAASRPGLSRRELVKLSAKLAAEKEAAA